MFIKFPLKTRFQEIGESGVFISFRRAFAAEAERFNLSGKLQGRKWMPVLVSVGIVPGDIFEIAGGRRKSGKTARFFIASWEIKKQRIILFT